MLERNLIGQSPTSMAVLEALDKEITSKLLTKNNHQFSQEDHKDLSLKV